VNGTCSLGCAAIECGLAGGIYQSGPKYGGTCSGGGGPFRPSPWEKMLEGNARSSPNVARVEVEPRFTSGDDLDVHWEDSYFAHPLDPVRSSDEAKPGRDCVCQGHVRYTSGNSSESEMEENPEVVTLPANTLPPSGPGLNLTARFYVHGVLLQFGTRSTEFGMGTTTSFGGTTPFTTWVPSAIDRRITLDE
jgi:hypothetical protein